MKKVIAFLLIAVLAIPLLAACGRRANDSADDWGWPMVEDAEMFFYGATGEVGDFMVAESVIMARGAPAPASAPTPAMEPAVDSAPGDGGSRGTNTGSVGERIIHTVSADIETLEFDATIAMIHDMIEQTGGFIEHSHVGGRSIVQPHHDWWSPHHRTASFTLRIPQYRIHSVAGDLGRFGNVTSLWRDAMNVTAQFIDTESRLTALRIQEERLLYMLEQATRIADMIEIEARVSDIRFEIEWLTTSLIHLQNRVDFSTLTLFVMEVEELTEITPLPRTYWQRVGDGFSSTMRGIGEFFMDLFRGIATIIPVVVLVVVVVIPGVVIIRRKIRSGRKAKLLEEELPEE